MFLGAAAVDGIALQACIQTRCQMVLCTIPWLVQLFLPVASSFRLSPFWYWLVAHLVKNILSTLYYTTLPGLYSRLGLTIKAFYVLMCVVGPVGFLWSTVKGFFTS